MLGVVQAEVDLMLAEDTIEISSSAWSRFPVIVKKPGGISRFCMDHRDVNGVTKKDAYTMQNIDSILNRLRKAKFLSKIDRK